MSTVFQIKHSLDNNTPGTSLETAEIAYSYASGKLFLGDGVNPAVEIGGTAYTSAIASHVALDGSLQTGIAEADSAVILGANKDVDTIDIGTLKITGTELTATANSLNILTGFSDVLTDASLASASATTLATSGAIKDYVDTRTSTSLSSLNFDVKPEGGILIADSEGVYQGKSLSGDVTIDSLGVTTVGAEKIVNGMIANSTIENGKLANPTFTIDGTTFELGQNFSEVAFDLLNASNLPINTGSIGTLAVNRGGTGTTTNHATGVMIGNGTDSVVSSGNLTFDGSTLAVTGDTTVSGTTTVTGATTLNDATQINSTLGVTGAATLGNTLAVTAGATVGGTLGVTGATTLSDTLGVTGATTLSDTLTVAGTTTLQGQSFFGGNAQFNSDVLISGDLIVRGNTTSVEVSTLEIEDSLLLVAKGNASLDEGVSLARDFGIYGEYVSGGNTLYSGIFQDASRNREWVVVDGANTTPDMSVMHYTDDQLGTIRAALISHNATITGGNISCGTF